MRNRIFALLITAVLLTASAFAAEKGNLSLSSDTTIGGTKVAAGDYTVQWTPDGQVTIWKQGKEVAKATATIEKSDNAGSNGRVVNKTGADGTQQAVELHVKKSVLKLEQKSGASGEVSATQ